MSYINEETCKQNMGWVCWGMGLVGVLLTVIIILTAISIQRSGESSQATWQLDASVKAHVATEDVKDKHTQAALSEIKEDVKEIKNQVRNGRIVINSVPEIARTQ